MGQLITFVAPKGKVIQSNTYDAEGNLLTQLDGEENKVSFEYDFMNNRIIIRSKGELKQRFEYDARGNIIEIMDGEKKPHYILDK